MIDRGQRLAPVLVLALGLPGCVMIRGQAEITGRRAPAAAAPLHLPVSAAVQAQVFQDGIHAPGDEAGEEYRLLGLLGRTFLASGLMARAVAEPAPDALNLVVEVEEERTGPIGLRIAARVTLRVIPAWTRIRYRLRARGVYGDRSLPPFAYESTATVVENVLLLPLAPFLSPDVGRARMRSEAVRALAAHLAAALARGVPPEEGTTR